MRVAVVHNRYLERGGEDTVFEAEVALLRDHGQEVDLYVSKNDDLSGNSRLAMAATTVWNHAMYRRLAEAFRRSRPSIVHIHNTFPLVSPAVYYAARLAGAAVVQTLHNYRLVCPSGLLSRGGAPCELCLGKPYPWPAIAYACYRRSHAASAVTATMLGAHRAVGTYRRTVTRFIALTEFAKGRFVAGGLDGQRISVKPNFVSPDPGRGDGAGGYALYVGRLSPEKGIQDLLAAWRELGLMIPLRIVGDGPLAPAVREAATLDPMITWLGSFDHSRVMAELRSASVLIAPSRVYEGMPMVLLEAFATATPVIASRLGGVPEIVDEGMSGRLVAAGDVRELVETVRGWFSDSGGHHLTRANARIAFETRFTADVNYELLSDIYARALGEVG